MLFTRRLLALTLSLLLMINTAFSINAQASKSDTSGNIVTLKKTLPDMAKPNSKKILAIAEKYYKMALANATTEEKNYLRFTITWKPDFTSRIRNIAKAAQYSFPSAFLTGYTNFKGLYLAQNCAVFSLDIKNSTSAENMASSIVAYFEDSNKKSLASSISMPSVKSFIDDASAAYEYALSLELNNSTLSKGAIQILINYGNVCIDTNKSNKAKLLLETALSLDPDYLEAKEALAAYWLSVGNRTKAEKILEKFKIPSVYRTTQKIINESDEKKVPSVTGGDSLDNIEKKLNSITKMPTILASDYFSDLDPKDAANARKFVDNLNKQWKFTAPNIYYLTQYTSLANFFYGGGYSAYSEFKNALANYKQDHSLSTFAFQPYKYRYAAIGNILATDRLNDSRLKEASKTAPELAVFFMEPGKYLNPNDLFTQKYNMYVLIKKLSGYGEYFPKQFVGMIKVVQQDEQELKSLLYTLDTNMSNELKKLEEIHEESHNANIVLSGPEYSEKLHLNSDQCDQCKIERHKIHTEFLVQINSAMEAYWADAVNFVSVRYQQNIKPKIDSMYTQCMRNCLLISDPKVRKRMTDEINKEVYSAVSSALDYVGSAYQIAESNYYPRVCDCDLEEVKEAQERIKAAHEMSENNRIDAQRKAMQEFKSGEIRESSPLYKKLDKYSTTVQLMFMTGKIHPLKTEVTYKFGIPEGPSTEIKITEDHLRNTTTYSGGLTTQIEAGTPGGALSVSGSLTVRGEITFDGKGNVQYVDVSGTAEGSLTAGNMKATGTYETSVMRGNKLSGEVSKMLNYNMLQIPGDISQALPEVKKVLWSGEYKLSN